MTGTKSTRDRIIEVATKCFWRDGYHLTSTDAICKAANVKKGSLYHAFPAKSDLLAAALDHVWKHDAKEIQAIYSQDVPIEDKFRQLLEWHVSSQRKLRDEFGMVVGTFDMALGVSIPAEVLVTITKNTKTYFAFVYSSIAQMNDFKSADEDRIAWLADIIAQVGTSSHIKARMGNDLKPLEQFPTKIYELMDYVKPAVTKQKKMRKAIER